MSRSLNKKDLILTFVFIAIFFLFGLVLFLFFPGNMFSSEFISEESSVDHFPEKKLEDILWRGKKFIILTYASRKYFGKAVRLFKLLREVGHYEGELGFFYSSNSSFTQQDFDRLGEGVRLFEFPHLKPPNCDNGAELPLSLKPRLEFYADKYYLFHETWKQWDRVMYLDAGNCVFQDVDGLIERLYNGTEGGFWGRCIRTMNHMYEMMEQYQNLTERFYERYGKECLDEMHAFNSGQILFDPQIIQNDSMAQMIQIHEEFGNLSGVCEGDQPPMNIYVSCVLKVRKYPYECGKEQQEHHLTYVVHHGGPEDGYILTQKCHSLDENGDFKPKYRNHTKTPPIK